MRLFLIYIPVLLIGRLYAASLELTRPKSYCGTKLTRIMSQFCLIYPTLPDHRQKRQIATECCHNKCSLNYLLENYCGTINTEALERFKLDFKNSEESVTPPLQVRDRRRSSRYGQGDSTEEEELTPRSRKGVRGKRNCTCKKHQRKRKAKRSEMKILLRRRPPLPEARIGLIEGHQEPFYVGTFGK